MQSSISKNIINALAIAVTLALVLFGVYGWFAGWYRDVESMREFMWRAGALAPLAFVTVQVLQVVLPFIPGGVTMLCGVIVFGPWLGFVLNFIGVAVGSGINFTLAKKYGKPLVTALVDEATYNKYIGRIESSKAFERFFALAILLPLFPDDTLCLIAGLTKMSYKKFTAIILLGKPASIAVYSFATQLLDFMMLH